MTNTTTETRIQGTEEIQVTIEQGMKHETREQYMRALASAQAGGREIGMAYGQRLVSLHTDTFAKAIETWLGEAAGKRGRRHNAIEHLSKIDHRTAAWMTLREIVTRISLPRLKLSSLAIVVGRAVLTEIEMRKLKKTDKALHTGILKVADKKSEQSRKEAAALFMMREAGVEAAPNQDDRLCLLVGSKLVELAVESLGILELELTHQTSTRSGKAHKESAYIVRPTAAVLKWIEEGHGVFQDLNPVYLPMVVPPVKWSEPLVGGYLTNEVRPLTLVKTRSRSYFRRLSRCQMPQVYEAINRIQETPWRINLRILDLLEAASKTNAEMGGMPRTELHELPAKPEDIETNEEARVEYRKKALRVHEKNVALIGRQAKVRSVLAVAQKFAKYESIYFPYQLDFRGRVYPVTALSPQGEDFVKALLEFAEGEALGSETAANWLAIHIANLFGVDKVAFDERVQWTKDNTEMLLAIAENPFDNRQWEDADKPWQALAAAIEWAGYMKDGLAHVSRIPVALDGSCSGLQNFGMALRCEVTGKSVNLLPQEKPADIYQEVINKVQVELVRIAGDDWQTKGEDAIKAQAREACRGIYSEHQIQVPFQSWLDGLVNKQYDDEGQPIRRGPAEDAAFKAYWNVIAAFAWLRFGINPTTGKMSRSIAKRSVMTFPYGSKEFGFRDQLKEDIIRPDLKDNPKTSHFRECDWAAAMLMANLLWNSVNATVLKAAEAMEWLQKAARLVAKEGKKVSWTTPLGFLVEQGYMKEESALVRTAFAGVERQITVNTQTNEPDSRKQASGIAPNFVHSLDSTHLMLTVARAPDIKSWALIHDSFGTLPSKTQSLFMYVRVAFVELYSAFDVMSRFREQVILQLDAGEVEELPSLPTKGNLDLYSVLQSKYCFA